MVTWSGAVPESASSVRRYVELAAEAGTGSWMPAQTASIRMEQDLSG